MNIRQKIGKSIYDLLFGSDFSINLLVSSTNCYSDNPEAFAKAAIDLSRKKNLCELNLQRFLFGK